MVVDSCKHEKSQSFYYEDTCLSNQLLVQLQHPVVTFEPKVQPHYANTNGFEAS